MNAQPGISGFADDSREYRLALWALAVAMIIGGGFVAGCIWFVAALWSGAMRHGHVFLLIGMAALLALFGACLIVAAFRTKVVLTADGLEVNSTGFRTRHLARSEIAGRRLLKGRYSSTLQICTATASGKNLKMPLYMKTDATYEAWIKALPDLDAEEMRISEAEIAADPQFGATPDERRARLAAGQKLASGFNVVAYSLGLWGYFYPYPYDLALAALVILPIVSLAVVVRSAGLYRINRQRNSAYPSFVVPVVLPGFVLMLRALSDVSLLDWKYPLLIIIAVGLVIAMGMARIDPVPQQAWRSLQSGVLMWWLLMCPLSYGAIALANAQLDASAGQRYQTTVLAKSVNHGRRHTSYYLDLAPWGPRTEPRNVGVPRRTYAAAHVGDAACVDVHPGAFRMPWYRVNLCRAGY